VTRRRFIERGDGAGDWSLLVRGDDVMAVRTVPHDGQLYYSTERRRNRADKSSEFQLDVDEVVERYAERSGTETPIPELLEDVERALSAADPGGETP